MTTGDLTAALRDIRCLQGAEAKDLEKLGSVSHSVEFSAGDILFREGDAASRSFMIRTGDVFLEICAPGVGCRRISTVGSGELLGWSPVLEGARLTATARAAGTVQAIEVPASELLALCQASPRFGYMFMRGVAQTLAQRLSAARVQLLDVYGSEAAVAGSTRP